MKPLDIYIPVVYGYAFFVVIIYLVNAFDFPEHLHIASKIAIASGIFYLLSLLYLAKNLNLNTEPVPYDETPLEFQI